MSKIDQKPPSRTTAQRGSRDIWAGIDSLAQMIKPGELVEVLDGSALTLVDRRTYNLLIAHAWEHITEPVEHAVPIQKLRGTHKGGERVADSVERLMQTLIRIRHIVDGRPHITRVTLLGGNTMVENEADPDGMLRYRFDPKLCEIIANSTHWGRLRIEIMFALPSKYALALYEMIEKRGRLDYKSSEEFTLDALRNLLGVPQGKLKPWSNFDKFALRPAVDAVCGLSDFVVEAEPLRRGRGKGIIEGVRLSWRRKETDELKAAWTELQRHRTGRQARLKGQVEHVGE